MREGMLLGVLAVGLLLLIVTILLGCGHQAPPPVSSCACTQPAAPSAPTPDHVEEAMPEEHPCDLVEAMGVENCALLLYLLRQRVLEPHWL